MEEKSSVSAAKKQPSYGGAAWLRSREKGVEIRNSRGKRGRNSSIPPGKGEGKLHQVKKHLPRGRARSREVEKNKSIASSCSRTPGKKEMFEGGRGRTCSFSLMREEKIFGGREKKMESNRREIFEWEEGGRRETGESSKEGGNPEGESN